MLRREEALVPDAPRADVARRIPARFARGIREKAIDRRHGAWRGDRIIGEAQGEQRRADLREYMAREISFEVRPEMAGPQAPAAPLLVHAARQWQPRPATTAGHIPLEGQQQRPVHAPEPPGEVLERR